MRHGASYSRSSSLANTHMGDPELAISIAFRTAAAALAIGFLEQLAVYDRAFGAFGPFSRGVATALRTSVMRRLVAGSGVLVVLCLGATAASIAAGIGPLAPAGRVAGAVTFVCVVVSKWRRVSASDGAEQMALLVIFATSIALLPGVDPDVLELAVWFVGAQTVLSYATAGIAKVFSPTWTTGEALALIMGSESHGQPWVSTLLQRHPAGARLLTRAAVAFECAFILVLVAPAQFTIAMLIVGVVFHVGCAITMGLNTFLVVFPGTYACVVYIAQRASPFW
jgi:hypothetical protein